MFTFPYVHVVQIMHDFKFLINTFFTMHGHASSSAFSKWAYKQYAYSVSHIHASILSIFLFTHCIVKILYLTNYGQKANLWIFWTFSYGGKFRNLGGNRDVRALWMRILPRGMRNIERTWWNRKASGTKSSSSDKSIGKTPTWIGCPPSITPIPWCQASLWEPEDATEALWCGTGAHNKITVW
jgi:hypothetical protein